MGLLHKAGIGVFAVFLTSFVLGVYWVLFASDEALKHFKTISQTEWPDGLKNFASVVCINSWQLGSELHDNDGQPIAIDNKAAICSIEDLSPVTHCCQHDSRPALAEQCAGTVGCNCLQECIQAGASHALHIPPKSSDPRSIFSDMDGLHNCMLQCQLREGRPTAEAAEE